MNAHSLRVRMPQFHSTQFTMPHSIQREPFHRNNYALRETTHLKTAFHSHRSVNHTIFMSACERLNETRHCLNLPTSVWLFSLVWRENIQAHFLLYEYFQLIAHLINYLLCHETKNMFASERGKIETVDAVLHALDVELNSSIIRTSNPINRCFFFRLIFFFQYRCRLCRFGLWQIKLFPSADRVVYKWAWACEGHVCVCKRVRSVSMSNSIAEIGFERNYLNNWFRDASFMVRRCHSYAYAESTCLPAASSHIHISNNKNRFKYNILFVFSCTSVAKYTGAQFTSIANQ